MDTDEYVEIDVSFNKLKEKLQAIKETTDESTILLLQSHTLASSLSSALKDLNEKAKQRDHTTDELKFDHNLHIGIGESERPLTELNNGFANVEEKLGDNVSTKDLDFEPALHEIEDPSLVRTDDEESMRILKISTDVIEYLYIDEEEASCWSDNDSTAATIGSDMSSALHDLDTNGWSDESAWPPRGSDNVLSATQDSNNLLSKDEELMEPTQFVQYEESNYEPVEILRIAQNSIARALKDVIQAGKQLCKKTNHIYCQNKAGNDFMKFEDFRSSVFAGLSENNSDDTVFTKGTTIDPDAPEEDQMRKSLIMKYQFEKQLDSMVETIVHLKIERETKLDDISSIFM